MIEGVGTGFSPMDEYAQTQDSMRTLIVTAADETYFPLVEDLIQSLQQWDTLPFTDLACFDVGLASNSRSSIAGRVSHIIEPGWDLPMDGDLRRQEPALRAQTVRPFLPRYFPGYDVYLWIDADAWVQEQFALRLYIASAAQGLLSAVPQFHVAYQNTPWLLDWRTSRMRAYFGQEPEGFPWDVYLNSGIFALRSDAPHWVSWARWFTSGLEATSGKLCSDQTALNYAVWSEQLPLYPLPALCNWLCHLAWPEFDSARRRFCEPGTRNPIGILHLTGHTKNAMIGTLNGSTTNLRFPRIHRYTGWRQSHS